MNPTANLQEQFTSSLDRRKICSYTVELIDKPTDSIIHTEARYLFFTAGEGVFCINGKDYNISVNTFAVIYPWDITSVKQVNSTLEYVLLRYNYDFIHGFLRSTYNPTSTTVGLFTDSRDYPVCYCNDVERMRILGILNDLKREVGNEVILESFTDKKFSDAYISNNIIGLLILFNRIHKKADADTKDGDRPIVRVNQILKYIYSHLQDKVSLVGLSKIFFLSESTISKLLSEVTGYSFSEIVNEMRVEKAMNMLTYTNLKLEEISKIAGFTDSSHLIRVFSGKTGSTPNEYKKTYKSSIQIINEYDKKLSGDIITYIHENYTQDSLSATMVAENFNISVVALNSILLLQVEKNFNQYVEMLRINKAVELLTTSDAAITDIAINVGYNTAKTFTRSFVKLKKVSPGRFRNSVTGRAL